MDFSKPSSITKYLIANEGNEIDKYLNYCELLRYAYKKRNKHLFIHIIKNCIGNVSEYILHNTKIIVKIILSIYRKPAEIIEIVDYIRTSIYRKWNMNNQYIGAVFENLSEHYYYGNYSQWRKFINYYVSLVKKQHKYRFEPNNSCMFLRVILKYNGYKKMKSIQKKLFIRNSNTEFKNPMINLLKHEIISPSKIGISKNKIIRIIMKEREDEIDYWNCNNIIYCKYMAKYRCDLCQVINFGMERYIDSRYLALKYLKNKVNSKDYLNFIKKSEKLYLSRKSGYGRNKFHIIPELFYHLHRRDKTDLNKLFAINATTMYTLLSGISSKFISKNLTRLSGYYV